MAKFKTGDRVRYLPGARPNYDEPGRAAWEHGVRAGDLGTVLDDRCANRLSVGFDKLAPTKPRGWLVREEALALADETTKESAVDRLKAGRSVKLWEVPDSEWPALKEFAEALPGGEARLSAFPDLGFSVPLGPSPDTLDSRRNSEVQWFLAWIPDEGTVSMSARSSMPEKHGHAVPKTNPEARFAPGDRAWHAARKEWLVIVGEYQLNDDDDDDDGIPGYDACVEGAPETKFFAFDKYLQSAPESDSVAESPSPRVPERQKQPKKETPMKPIKIETVVVIDGLRVDGYDAGARSALLARHEQEIKRLEALEFKTQETKDEIAALRAGAEAAMKAFDADYAKRKAAKPK